MKTIGYNIIDLGTVSATAESVTFNRDAVDAIIDNPGALVRASMGIGVQILSPVKSDSGFQFSTTAYTGGNFVTIAVDVSKDTCVGKIYKKVL